MFEIVAIMYAQSKQQATVLVRFMNMPNYYLYRLKYMRLGILYALII